MIQDEALRQIAELHTAWSLKHGDEVPYVAEHSKPHDGETSDLSIWQADRSAPPEIDDPLNEKIKAILAQIDDESEPTALSVTLPRNAIDPSDIDLDAVQESWERRLDQLLSDWTEVTRDQRRQIADRVRMAITADDLNAIAAMSVSTAEATELLTEAMTDIALSAAKQASREAAKQGVRIDPVASDTSTFAAVAGVMALLLAEGLTNSAGREALRRWSPSTSGDDVAKAVDEHLAELSDSFLAANLGGALTSAQNTGRMNTFLSGPSVALYASERNDSNTCKFCAAVDGRWIGNSDDPDIWAKVQAIYPNGGYVDCLGGVRCRGTIVAVYRPEQVQS